MKIKLLSVLCIFLFFYSFIVHSNDFNIPLFGGVDSDIRLNIETKDDIKVYANEIEIKQSPNFPFNSYKTYEINNYPVNKLSFKGYGINSAVISTGHNLFYFNENDINNFEKDEKGNFLFPKKMKYCKNSKYITDKGNLHRFFINFLSIFYNPYYFILPVFCLIVLLLNLKFTIFKNSAILWIILIGLILRLSDLIPSYWSDELYTVYLAENAANSLSGTFQDPGNPPLFFILAKLWILIFGDGQNITRLLPCLFSIAAIYLIYYFAKKSKAGILTAFLFAINIYAIVSAQELRCYSLMVCLAVLLSVYLFKLIKETSNKNFILYCLIASLSFNCHFYLSFILFSNFIYGLIFLKNKERLKFFIANLIAFLTFVPYLLLTGFKKGFCDKSFNNFNFSGFDFYLDTIQKYTGKFTPFIFLIIFIILAVPKFKNKIFKNEKIPAQFYYSLYLIISTCIFVYLFSFIRPLTKDWYFICLLPFFILIVSYLMFLPFKNIKIKCLFVAVLILSYFAPNAYIKRERARLLNFDNIVSFYSADKKTGNSTLIIPHSKEMLSFIYKNLNEDELTVFPLPQDEEKLINLIKMTDKNEVYLKVEYNILPSFLIKISKFYKVSFIRTDKDVIITKILKEKAKLNED